MKKVFYFMAAALLSGLCACKTQKETVSSVNLQSIDGSWNIISVNGGKIIGDEPAHLTFNTTEKRMYGNNGCNVINGAIVTDAANPTSIQFEQVISTMKACMPNSTDGEVMQAINETKSFKVTASDATGITKIALCNDKKKEMLVLSRKEINTLNGNWTVKKLNGEEVTVALVPTMTLDITNGKLSGNAGCNRINGTIKTDASNDKAISFDQVTTTMMLCPGANVEAAFKQALSKVAQYKTADKTTVELLDEDGNALITLIKE